jgi:hypothetical protein
MKMSIKKIAAAALLLGVAFQPITASAQIVKSSIYGDDEFKIFISTNNTSEGVEFAQGFGWAANFQNTLYLYPGATTYYMHIWVRDLGGAPTGLLGEFTMPASPILNPRGCRFANNSVNLRTTDANNRWLVSPTQPYSTPITGGPFGTLAAPQFNNVIPRFAQATLTPLNLGTNASQTNPWPQTPLAHPFPGVNGQAKWLWVPAPENREPEAWFTTKITCQSPN